MRWSSRPSLTITVGGTLLLLAPSAVGAQELEPRAYSNTPVGLNFIAFGYRYSSGNVLMDPSLPIEGLDASLHLLFLNYTRSFSLFGRSAKIKALVPWSEGDWEGSLQGEEFRRRRTDNGAGDAVLSLEVNFLGAPAMDRGAFREYRQRWIAGARLRVVAPTGEYDPERLLNLGSNRWTYKPEVGVSRALERWTLEAGLGVWLFEDNDDFFGGSRLRQNELYVAKTHLVYGWRPGLWAALGIGWGNGGQTFINGEPRQTLQSNWRFAVTLAYPLTPSQGLILTLGSGVTRRTGGDYDNVALAYQYAWGGR